MTEPPTPAHLSDPNDRVRTFAANASGSPTPPGPNPRPEGAAVGRTGPSPALVRQAIAGDHLALRSLWEANRRWVAAVILAHKPASADVDDILQDVAVSVVAKVSSLDDPSNFQPWLRVVAMNAARLVGRKLSVGPRMVRFESFDDEAGALSAGTTDGAFASRSAGPARQNEVGEEAGRLMALAMEMHPDYREPLLLRCVHELSYAEIGSILGLPETTIETRIARGRKMLRERALAMNSVDGLGGQTRSASVAVPSAGTGRSVRLAASPDAAS